MTDFTYKDLDEWADDIKLAARVILLSREEDQRTSAVLLDAKANFRMAARLFRPGILDKRSFP